jgi:hypothetical protein
VDILIDFLDVALYLLLPPLALGMVGVAAAGQLLFIGPDLFL